MKRFVKMCMIAASLTLSGAAAKSEDISPEIVETVARASDLFWIDNQAKTAWDLLETLGDTPYTELYTLRAFIIASGQLSGGFDRCAAILNAERAAERGNMMPAYGLLRGLYEGEWISIAALEGSRIALFFKGYRLLTTDRYPNALAMFDNERPLRDAAPYLYLSAELGHEPAIRQIRALERDHPGIYSRNNYSDAIDAYTPIEIYCPPRAYEKGDVNWQN
ncbi:hypothetical protein [Hoeflea prorocentri]|uniref:Sel1 repeat family protein n=1 Tax=Hoeflea prorocentri TaxID=1922333 RepID=A0A9X3ZGP8_9HYPH|nr:hypothetical protein [Hoeflea prorocentri]MCY6380997.1 hypothetical protein [Hoeflea prorocentri]MDA5398797.1 hypothetical protein [Hoeflea prorocentri]